MYKLKEFPSKWGCLNHSLSKYCSTNLNRKHIYNRFETMSCWTILQPQTSHNMDRAPYTIVLCIAFHHCRYTFRLTNMAASHVSCIKFGPAQVVQYGQLDYARDLYNFQKNASAGQLKNRMKDRDIGLPFMFVVCLNVADSSSKNPNTSSLVAILVSLNLNSGHTIGYLILCPCEWDVCDCNSKIFSSLHPRVKFWSKASRISTMPPNLFIALQLQLQTLIMESHTCSSKHEP